MTFWLTIMNNEDGNVGNYCQINVTKAVCRLYGNTNLTRKINIYLKLLVTLNKLKHYTFNAERNGHNLDFMDGQKYKRNCE